MLRGSFRWGLSFLVVLVACSSEPPPPGFEPVGGEGGVLTGTGSGASSQGGAPTTSTMSGPTTTTMSGPTTTTTTTGGAGGAGGEPAGTGGSGLTCDTGDEPNDSESTAVDLGVITDCDGDGSSFTGELSGINDQDWYKYEASDDFGCSVDATRDVMAAQAVRFCKYAQCLDDSDPALSCPDGTDDATSPDGRPGCCGDAGFTFAPDCSGISDDARVYLQLRTLSNDCVAYTVDYHY
jgi:hypothetical protein